MYLFQFRLLCELATPPPMEGIPRIALPNLILATTSLGNPRLVTFAILATHPALKV